MSEPAPVLTAALPAPGPEAQVPCERCGTFLQGPPVQVGAHKVCPDCAALLHKELRLYPNRYVVGVGVLLNFFLAGVLAAINWKRLGDRARMRNSAIVAGLGVVWMGSFMALDLPMGAGLVANVVGTLVATQGMAEAYARHRREGGADANRLWPLLLFLGGLVVMVVLVTVLLMALGVELEE